MDHRNKLSVIGYQALLIHISLLFVQHFILYIDSLFQVLLYVYFSRNGLAITELVDLIKIPQLSWVAMLEEFTDRMFFTNFNGFLSYANRQVGHSVKRFSGITYLAFVCK